VRVRGRPALDVGEQRAQLQADGPGSPSPITHLAAACLTRPIGVITAAVPQPKTSVIRPSAAPSRHSSRRCAAR
jgi:hypothetical protein